VQHSSTNRTSRAISASGPPLSATRMAVWNNFARQDPADLIYSRQLVCPKWGEFLPLVFIINHLLHHNVHQSNKDMSHTKAPCT
jgi:hypothetical protein